MMGEMVTMTKNRTRMLKIIGGVALVAAVVVALVLLGGPAAFRGLSPEDQTRLIRVLPFLASWQPASNFSVLPTVAAPDLPPDPLLLLGGGTPAPASTPTATPRPASRVTLPPARDLPAVYSPADPPPIQQPAQTGDPAATPTLLPSPTPAEIPVAVRLEGMTWEPQKFNNCGPANLIQAMRFLKWRETQEVVAGWLKPSKLDKNVSPWQLVEYVNTRTNGQLRALTRVSGNLGLVKQLVARRFGVIVETGFYDPDDPQEGWIGHYLTIIGYDDNQARLYKLDTYKGEKSEDYAVIDELWSHFNRRYLVVYPPEREAELAQIIGPDMDTTHNARQSLETAIVEARLLPSNPFVWFNLASSLTLLGRYAEAAQYYDYARSVNGGQLPYRITWYEFGPFEAYYNAGRYDDALALIAFTIETSKGEVEEMFYWRGMIAAARGDVANAVNDFTITLRFNANFTPAAVALQQVQSGTFKPPAL
jgi:hypothetical protein